MGHTLLCVSTPSLLLPPPPTPPLSSAVLAREAKPDKGKCCDKYVCTQDQSALCAARRLKQPCNDVCPACYSRRVVTPANPAAGICCPVIRCVYNAATCCSTRTNKNCPLPDCDLEFENSVVTVNSNSAQLRCCQRRRCEVDPVKVCAAKVLRDPLGPENPVCSSCEVAVETREADPANGRCWPRVECLPDPTDRCCGFDNSTCEAPPVCGPFTDLEVVRPVNRVEGQCCTRYACVNNNTRICDAFQCDFNSAADYMAARCPNPRGRNWYTVEEKRAADPAAGRCCPKYKCRETVEKKLYDAESALRRRRRRRRSSAATTAAPTTAAP